LRRLGLGVDGVAGDRAAPPSVSVASSARAAVISFSPAATARWPTLSRASAPKAVTTCSAERFAARSKARRSVLPSMASRPHRKVSS